MKKIIIDSNLFEIFPETHIGFLHLKSINNQISVEALLRDAEKHVRENYSNALIELPEIQEWRDAYKKLGIKKGTRVSVEALIKRVQKGGQIPSINPLVDLYNAISLKYVFPCGGEDLLKTNGDIHLTFANGEETFYQIGSNTNEPPNENEIVYKDSDGCLCRCWNWREADRTKLTEDTTEAILVIESLSASRLNDLENALNQLSQYVQEYLSAEASPYILNKLHQVIELE